jgi:hypothetical protein
VRPPIPAAEPPATATTSAIYDAIVASSDPGSDLALLLSEAPESPLSLEPSDQQRQGDSALAFALAPSTRSASAVSLSQGIVGREARADRCRAQPRELGPTDSQLTWQRHAVDEFGMKDAAGLNFGIASESVQGLPEWRQFRRRRRNQHLQHRRQRAT